MKNRWSNLKLNYETPKITKNKLVKTILADYRNNRSHRNILARIRLFLSNKGILRKKS